MFFEPNLDCMRAYGVSAPESLVTVHSKDHIFLPLENYEGLDARLEQNASLGHVKMYDFCDSCEAETPPTPENVLQVQAHPLSQSTVSNDPRSQELLKVLG